jgi:hypothetical protein
MSVSSQLKSRATQYRPSGASASEISRLVKLAAAWFARLEPALRNIKSDAFILTKDQRLELALAMTEMADDLHADSGIWRALESSNLALFRTPLPGLREPTDPPPTRLDARRFHFFLDGVWRHFQPDAIVSPRHLGFAAIAADASDFFSTHLGASPPEPSSVSTFLDSDHSRAWDVKRKLVWLGTRSFLLRFAHADYVTREAAQRREPPTIALTDDFLSQECTAWSGLGALELLAERLGLFAKDRAELLGWHARHIAFYRIDTIAENNDVLMTMGLKNLVNEQPYLVRVEMPRARLPFQIGNMVFGGLVPWRGEWYWSGTQQRWPEVPGDFPNIKREFFHRSALITYRYCPDRAAKARTYSAEQHDAFVRFHGTDLAVFPDGLTMAAAEQRRTRHYNQSRAAELDARYADLDHVKNGPSLPYPPEIIDCTRGVGLFSQPGESIEIFREFDVLCAALRASETPLSEDQSASLQGFIESPAISPAFVRRVIARHGSAGLSSLYHLPPGDSVALDHLLRRHKGAYYRPRPPDITLVDD